MTVEKQMRVADEVLSMTYPIDPAGIIAGGAPRDWYFGNLASDLDFFFYRPDLTTLHSVKSVLSSVGFKGVDNVEMEELEDHGRYKRNEFVDRVLETKYKGVKVQFIQMNAKTFNSVVPKFPLSICRVWYKFEGIQVTREFEISVRHKVIIKLDELYADGDRYVKKIRDKFPDYEYYTSYQELAMGRF